MDETAFRSYVSADRDAKTYPIDSIIATDKNKEAGPAVKPAQLPRFSSTIAYSSVDPEKKAARGQATSLDPVSPEPMAED